MLRGLLLGLGLLWLSALTGGAVLLWGLESGALWTVGVWNITGRLLGTFLLLLSSGAALALGWLILGRLFLPLRRLALEAGVKGYVDDPVEGLVLRVRRLLETVQRTRAELEESHENLRQTEKLVLVGKLAAGVAHSIRNPLTGLKLRVFSLTKVMTLGPRQQEDLAAIDDAIRHMEAITTNFLEFSRRPSLSMAPVDVGDVVEKTLSLLKPRLEAFQVRVVHKRPDMLPKVDADAEQLREALANIILNACEAMGVGGSLRISEESGRIEPLERAVVLRIADSGPGIPEDMCEAIFQPFISSKDEGTGLGLPIAKRIFEEHGGWLHVHSALGKGATFVAVVPARKDDDIWIRS
ncbi:MAG: ATP-binding protein [Desulfovibrionaceae bacterium]